VSVCFYAYDFQTISKQWVTKFAAYEHPDLDWFWIQKVKGQGHGVENWRAGVVFSDEFALFTRCQWRNFSKF